MAHHTRAHAEPHEVYDNRDKPFYQVNNDVVLRAGRVIGCFGIAAYNSLACHANKGGESWPSIALIADECGMSPRQASNAILLLEKNDMVLVERMVGRPSRYRLTNPDKWNLAIKMADLMLKSTPTPACGAEVSTPTPACGAEVSTPTPACGAEVSTPTPACGAEVSTPTPACGAEVSTPTPACGAEVSTPTPACGAEVPLHVVHTNNTHRIIPKKQHVLSELLLEAILKNNPDSRLHALTHAERKATIERWAKDVGELIGKDRIRPELVEAVIPLAASHKFWGRNVLSGDGLRRSWDRVVKTLRDEKILPAAGNIIEPSGNKGPVKVSYYEEPGGRWTMVKAGERVTVRAEDVPQHIRDRAEGRAVRASPAPKSPVDKLVAGLAGYMRSPAQDERL